MSSDATDLYRLAQIVIAEIGSDGQIGAHKSAISPRSYSGQNDADGYAVGLDMKVNGEFVKGVDSWFSLSLMQTEEDVRNDVWVKTDADGNQYETHPGYIPRPTDQRLNISMFFQDYFPGNPTSG